MKKTLTITGIIVALLLVGTGTIVLREASQSAEAQTAPAMATVTRGSIMETVSATGNVVADQQASLAFESSGPIDDVEVEKGQAVEQGQVLARLDTSSLEWQVARSQASLETAQARLEQARKPATEEDLASAQAALDSAIASLDNVNEGAGDKDIASAKAALDSAIANYDKVEAGPTKEDLAAAKAQVESAQAQVQQAQAAYDRVKDQPDIQMRQESVNLQNATISLEQAQATYDAQASRPTAAELASAEAQVAQAEAQLAGLLDTPANQLASAEAQVAQAEASFNTMLARPNAEDIAVQEAQVEEAALALAQVQSQLEDALITAPFAGTILVVNANEGEWASPGTPAFVLAATEPLILAINVDEVDVAQIDEGQSAELSFDAIKGKKVAGTVAYIAPASTNVGGAIAYAVDVSFEPGILPVRLGMTADVEVVVANVKDALLVPNQAIEADREAGRYYVTRQGTGTATERIEVQIGLRDEAYTEILEGLVEGDQLILPQVPERSESEQQFGPGQGGMPFGGSGT